MITRDEMIFSYNRLWHLLISRNLKKKDLIQMTGISQTVMANMSKGQPVHLRTLGRICECLGVDIGEIVEYKGNGSDS